MLLTSARRDGGELVIDGRKWLITGAVGADLGIVMARYAHDIATEYARKRTTFSKPIGEHEGGRFHARRQRDGHSPMPARHLAKRVSALRRNPFDRPTNASITRNRPSLKPDHAKLRHFFATG
jgi:hypothetical protein